MLSQFEAKDLSFARLAAYVTEECSQSSDPELRKLKATADVINAISVASGGEVSHASMLRFATQAGLIVAGAPGEQPPAQQPVQQQVQQPVMQQPPVQQPVMQPPYEQLPTYVPGAAPAGTGAYPAAGPAPVVAPPATATNREPLSDYLVRAGLQLFAGERGMPRTRDGHYVCKHCLAERVKDPFMGAEPTALGGHRRAHKDATLDIKEIEAYVAGVLPVYQEQPKQAAAPAAPVAAPAHAAYVPPVAPVPGTVPAQPERGPMGAQIFGDAPVVAAPAAAPTLQEMLAPHRTLEAAEDKSRNEVEMTAQLDAIAGNLAAAVTNQMTEVVRVLLGRIDSLETTIGLLTLTINTMSPEQRERVYAAYAQPKLTELTNVLLRKV